MIAIDDIKDRGSLKQWLSDWPAENGLDEKATRALAVSIAHRAAMRVLPLWWNWNLTDTALKCDLTALPILRCSLVSGVAAKILTPEIRAAARAAAVAEDAYAANAGNAVFPEAAYVANYAAIYAAADAANAAARAADAANAAAAAEAAATADARAAFWRSIQSDCKILSEGGDVFAAPLWNTRENPFEEDWRNIKTRVTAPEWSFWIKWYGDALAGKPPNWVMLEKIALIDSEVWVDGVEAVADEIRLIQDRFRTRENTELFKATLYDFKFDALRHVMLAVPMPQDWETLTDPDQLARFLRDALDLREDMAILSQAFAAEGSAMQGAGMTMTYMGQVLDELQNAETVGALRVGKLVEWGRILESAALREDTRCEFGVMAEPFGMAVGKLKDLIRNHFAHTLARFSVLREIRMEDDAQPWEVLKDLRAIVDTVRNGADGTLPALDAIDVVVLDDVLDSIDRMIRELDQTESEDSRNSLRRDIDFEIAKIGATAGLYGEKARNAVKKGGEISDEVLKWSKRGKGLWSMVRAVREWLEGSGGG